MFIWRVCALISFGVLSLAFPLTSDYSFTSTQLEVPHLENLTSVLNEFLKKNYAVVNVEVVDSPDLTQKPFSLAKEGIGGSTSLIDVGGLAYLLPVAQRGKVYDLKELVARLYSSPRAVVGAGAGPWPFLGVNTQIVANAYINGDQTVSHTQLAIVNKTTGVAGSLAVPANETRFSFTGNFFASEGKPSKVLKVSCKQRIGNESFVGSIRSALLEGFPNKTIGLGGTFILKSGKAKIHIMPDFSDTPVDSDEKLNKWFKFYEIPTPLTAVGMLISEDIPDLRLRVQHFHVVGNGIAGHYHHDTTPDDAEYVGYFNVAEKMYRVDRPKDKLPFGKI